MRATDWPRRWEVHERDDLDDVYGNTWVNVLGVIAEVAPDAVQLTP